MSFDLGVWRPTGQQVTVAEASRFYSELCSRPFQTFIPGPEMSAFVDAVVEHYRTASGTSGLPWAAEPDVSDDCAVMPIQSVLADAVFPIIRELARERDLVCFDPQGSRVYQPAAVGTARAGTLALADGRSIDGPDRKLVEECVRGLSEKDWFVTFKRRPNFYIQVGCGDRAGAPRGRYVIEYRDGSPDKHWRAFSSDLDELVPAFLEYHQGGMQWIGGFSWKPLAGS